LYAINVKGRLSKKLSNEGKNVPNTASGSENEVIPAQGGTKGENFTERGGAGKMFVEEVEPPILKRSLSL